MNRISKIDYYMNITKEVARRSTCFRAAHGSIIVKDDQIISTGYNGAPRKTKDCFERGNCLRDELSIPSGQRYEMCRSVHAEQNAIVNSARAGVSLLGGTIYLYSEKLDKGKDPKAIDAFPCFICKKIIINSGLKDMVVSKSDGSYKVYNIEDWVNEWAENDLIDDKDVYSSSPKEKGCSCSSSCCSK
ncbi:MAG: deaminase [Patescibacteria group bacterium]